MPELAPVTGYIVWLASMALVMGWLARTRLQSTAPPGDRVVLRMPMSVLILSFICVTMFSAFAVLSFASPTGGPLVSAGFAAFAALGAALAYVSIAHRCELLPDGLAYRSFLGARRRAAWPEIVQVRYVRSMQWFVIRLRDGRVLRLSAMLTGLPFLAQALLQHLQPDIIAPDSLALIRDAAAGRLPSIWV